MANILSNIQSTCPYFEKNTSARNLQKVINILTEVPKDNKQRLEMNAKIFVKRLSFMLRIFPRHVLERVEEIKKLEILAKQKKEKIAQDKLLLKKNKKLNQKKNEEKKIENLLKGVEIKSKNKKNNANKNLKNKKDKSVKQILKEKNIIKKNSKADDKFVKITQMTGSKGMTIASFIGQYVLKIAMLA